MKTNEVEKLTGLSKQTILFYEREKLVEPSRDDNGYRNYNDEDVQLLLLIKFLRSMNVSIDDIQLIIHDQLSFQDCLKTQSDYIEESIDSLKEMKSTISFYKERHIPMIPALAQLENIDEHTILGFQRTSPHVSIGRPLTKQYLTRKILLWVIMACLLSLVFYFGYQVMYKRVDILISVIVFFIIIMFQFICYGLGLGEIGFFSTNQNATQYVEFDETGLRFIDQNTFSKRIKHMWNILTHKEVLTHYSYEQIEKVIIKHSIRYMKIPGSQLSTNKQSSDFYFTFHDKTTYHLIDPMILDHDIEMIRSILKEKVKNLKEDDK